MGAYHLARCPLDDAGEEEFVAGGGGDVVEEGDGVVDVGGLGG